ncbi:cyclin N-terminal domain-containing protein 1 [Austrofundulus limnaeus]|uniref:Cyclin N-terminal domain-containing protein 1 n=1 Tax=Austrofundulus limnaeus TaxID=52670 RepID=A0A2I4D5R4_AUSLI|nr:PREDICTED: cyclin N-terminal domain-containing protein 1 [Austrofundulus limnaeus]
MEKHISDLLATAGAPADELTSDEGSFFDKLKEEFPLVLLSCVQLASKLFLHGHMIDSNAAVRFLQSIGVTVSKQTVLEFELMVFKCLEFSLNVLNPLTYVEMLLEVLGHNEPTIPIEHLYQLSRHVLQFITLERSSIYDTLLKTTTQSVNPSREQREKFVTVTEDRMLLGVGVIAVATFILHVKKWEQVVEELSHMTAISRRSIHDFTHVVVMHIVGTNSSKV